MARKPSVIKPEIDWTKPQQDWEFTIRIPVALAKPEGASIEAHGHLLSSVTVPAIEANEYIASAYDISERVKWCEDFDNLLCTFDKDGRTLVAIRKSTEEDEHRLRKPTFIQNEEWPMCCGRSMTLVAEIDDDEVADFPPPDAKVWWHDAATFHVFCCGQCLQCKAIGQQF